MTEQDFINIVKDDIQRNKDLWNRTRSRRALVYVKGQRDKNKNHKKRSHKTANAIKRLHTLEPLWSKSKPRYRIADFEYPYEHHTRI